MGLHHIGIVVDNLDEAIPIFQVWFGATRVGGIVRDEVQRARIQLFAAGDALIEAVEADPDSPIHHGGEFHLCFTVPDLDAEMARLRSMGAIVAHPHIVAEHLDGRRLGFIATHSGQLVELLEDMQTPVQ